MNTMRDGINSNQLIFKVMISVGNLTGPIVDQYGFYHKGTKVDFIMAERRVKRKQR
jgi:hypothetical protein